MPVPFPILVHRESPACPTASPALGTPVSHLFSFNLSRFHSYSMIGSHYSFN